jgi:xanthine dehydrogenase molybdenum-binding subunit
LSEKFVEVGKSRPPIFAPEVVKGSVLHTEDLRLPNMLYAKFLLSPYAHAKIKRIDTSAAERLPGVVSIITHKDVPKVKYNSSHVPDAMTRVDEYVLSDKARFIGDRLAAVAARDPDIAEEALELIDVDYEELPFVLDPKEAMKPDAPKIHEDVDNNIALHLTNAWGDVKKGFEEADLIFEDEYYTQAAHPIPLEPQTCVAYYKSGKVEIWTSNQVPHRVLPKLSRIFNMPQSKIRIYQPHIGGAFGNKCGLSLEPVAILLSMKSGAPVMMELTGEEMFLTTSPRHPSFTKLKIGVKKDGTIISKEVKTVLDTGAYVSHGTGVLSAAVYSSFGITSLYKCPNHKMDGYCVYTNKVPSGAFRGYGNPQVTFPLESMLDTIAEELGLDPMDLRLKNAVREGDVDPISKIVIESCGLQECARRASDAIGWKMKRGIEEKGKGVGTAWLMLTSGVHPIMDETCGAFVKIFSDGTVVVTMSAPDLGQGIMTTVAQIAAEELGVSVKDVSVTRADTNQPVNRGTWASGTLYFTGQAVRLAAADARSQLLKKAAEILEVRAENLRIESGKIVAGEEPKKSASFEEVMKEVEGGEIIGKATYVPSVSSHIFGVVCAEVEVDVETGEVNPIQVVYAHDIGRAINPAIVKGQIEGSIIQGLGYALTECLVWGKRGEMLNRTFVDYKILTSRDVPKLVPILVETKDKTGPYDAKGVGEPPIMAIAPAIANAIYDAVGIRIKEIPITPEKVLEKIREKKSRT